METFLMIIMLSYWPTGTSAPPHTMTVTEVKSETICVRASKAIAERFTIPNRRTVDVMCIPTHQPPAMIDTK